MVSAKDTNRNLSSSFLIRTVSVCNSENFNSKQLQNIPELMKQSWEKYKLYWKKKDFLIPGYSPFSNLKFCLLKRYKNKTLCASIINGPTCDQIYIYIYI